MTGTWLIQNPNELMETKWSPMLVLSVLFHLGIFSVFLFVPDSLPSRSIEGIIYEVNLVNMPAGGGSKPTGTTGVKEKKGKTIVKKDVRAKRIKEPEKKEEKPLVISKRAVQKETAPIKKPKTSPSKLIDKAISRIKKQVKSEDKADEGRAHIEKAISKLESSARGRGALGSPTGRSNVGIPIRIYQIEVENRIKSNWSYPVAMSNKKNLEAIVVVKVKRNGAILDTKFVKRSASVIFDQSVIKAIERSEPLPPFPEGYIRRYDEIEINFNLKELEGN